MSFTKLGEMECKPCIDTLRNNLYNNVLKFGIPNPCCLQQITIQNTLHKLQGYDCYIIYIMYKLNCEIALTITRLQSD